MIGIYKITSPTGKIYIGQSINIEKRFNTYEILDCKNQIRLYNSFKKHNVKYHKFEILEECIREQLNNRERYYQDLYNVAGRDGLNCMLTETDINPKILSKQTKLKMSIAKQNMSKETKIKMSESRKRLVINDEYRLKMSKIHKGRILSEDQKNKQSKNNPNIKLILNIETGIFYKGTKEASIAHNLNRITLIQKLNGRMKNNTNLVYA